MKSCFYPDLTVTTAVGLIVGQQLQHVDFYDAWGQPLRVRVARRAIFWKARPQDFSVLVEWRVNTWLTLTHENADGWRVTDEWVAPWPPRFAVTHLPEVTA